MAGETSACSTIHVLVGALLTRSFSDSARGSNPETHGLHVSLLKSTPSAHVLGKHRIHLSTRRCTLPHVLAYNRSLLPFFQSGHLPGFQPGQHSRLSYPGHQSSLFQIQCLRHGIFKNLMRTLPSNTIGDMRIGSFHAPKILVLVRTWTLSTTRIRYPCSTRSSSGQS